MALSIRLALFACQVLKFWGNSLTSFLRGWGFALSDELAVKLHLLPALEYRGSYASAVWVPACELKIFGVIAFEVIANIHKCAEPAFVVSVGVVVGKLHTDTHDKVQLLPAVVVGLSVCVVDLGNCEASCILVTATIYALLSCVLSSVHQSIWR